MQFPQLSWEWNVNAWESYGNWNVIFGNSAYKLNGLLFAFKTGIALDKIYGHILIGTFSLLSIT